jgi:hypothetical protein
MRIGLPRIRLRLLLPLAVAATAAVAVVFMGEGSAQPALQQKVIATASSNGFRVTVRAIREAAPGNEPDTATVKIAAFKRSGEEWNRLGRALTVGTSSSWFWNVVTRPYGVRQLTLALPGGRYPERISLRLLISPAIGPSATFRFVVDQGQLVAVDV